jgi:hypothetical protein
MSGIDQKRWYTRILHQRMSLGIQTFDQKSFNNIRTVEVDCKRDLVISGLINYDILSNPRYMNLFQYVPIEFRQTDCKVHFNRKNEPARLPSIMHSTINYGEDED